MSGPPVELVLYFTSGEESDLVAAEELSSAAHNEFSVTLVVLVDLGSGEELCPRVVEDVDVQRHTEVAGVSDPSGPGVPRGAITGERYKLPRCYGLVGETEPKEALTAQLVGAW